MKEKWRRAMDARCAECNIELSQRICRNPEGVGPGFCPTINSPNATNVSLEHYADQGTKDFAAEASRQEASCYEIRELGRFAKKTRLQELIEFSQRMGYKKLGLAFCSGVRLEAEMLAGVLNSHGFEVVSVICKAGCIPKEKLGLEEDEKINPGEFESMCNPIGQAEILNSQGTDFNIMLGLCIGHDSLFLKQSRAMTTVFAVKDRVTGHNPMAALYTTGSYYASLKKKE
jgi:uncharacterized metal-binding protein